MHHFELLIALLAVATAVAELAERSRLPYPILLLVVGIALGLVPGLPRFDLDPGLVFSLFLPPLLYAAAGSTSWPDFKAARRPIGLLALGCVLFTTGLVGGVAHWLLPGFGWPAALLLGAIVSPPDAVAAAAITQGLGLPRRVTAIIEGESLVNDATGLIAYRYALAAVATGHFVLWQASLQLVWTAAAGVVVGLAVGWLILHAHRLTESAVVGTSLTFLTPYIAYLLAEALHVSAVLAVVTVGLFLGRRVIYGSQARLRSDAVWSSAVFLLNGLVFTLMGLELPAILRGIAPGLLWAVLGYGVLISGAVVVARLLWWYPSAYAPHWLSAGIRAAEPVPPLALVSVVAWTGMRGVVSLAAALALPLTLPHGAPFPHRDVILLITFVVIFCTLVVQGLTLGPLIHWLGIRPDAQAGREEVHVRVQLAVRILEYLALPATARWVPAEVLVRMQQSYDLRLTLLRSWTAARKVRRPHDLREKPFTRSQLLQEELIRFERGVLQELQQQERTSDELLRKLENELDLEEARLELDDGLF
jgi:CPA1 family monovalent cation:H+ antiporter